MDARCARENDLLGRATLELYRTPHLIAGRELLAHQHHCDRMAILPPAAHSSNYMKTIFIFILKVKRSTPTDGSVDEPRRRAPKPPSARSNLSPKSHVKSPVDFNG